jgi:hypothetical protein
MQLGDGLFFVENGNDDGQLRASHDLAREMPLFHESQVMGYSTARL